MSAPKMPFDLDAEVSVLTELLLDPEAPLLVRAEDFYAERHRVVYGAIVSLRNAGMGVTAVTVKDELDRRGHLQTAGGVGYVASLYDGVATGIEHHARIVRDKAQLRRLIHACQQTIMDAIEGAKAEDVLLEAERRLLTVTETRQTSDGFRPVSEAVVEAMAMIERAAEVKGGVVGFRTGIPKLDMMTSGLERGGLTVLAGRPAMGKSALGWQIAERIAMDRVGVLVASYEMGAGQLGRRGLSRLAHIDSQRIRKGELTQDEWAALAKAGTRLASLPIWINEYPPHEVEALRSQVQRHRTKQPVGAVLVDYLQQMSGPKSSGNRNNEVEHISRGLKRMARELDVHVIALAQLSRGVENRTPPRPILSDLRDSGAIEQDADNVLLLWRPEYYFDDRTPQEVWGEWQGKAEAILAKQRDGETGRILLDWQGSELRFTEIEERTQAQRGVA